MTATPCTRCGIPAELPPLPHACLYRDGRRYEVTLCADCAPLLYDDPERYFTEGWEGLAEESSACAPRN